MKNHDHFYSYAEAYDVAFDFKDIRSECDFLRSIFEANTARRPNSFIDLAAGPALHAIEMARSGLQATALDLSQHMVDYGTAKAKKTGVEIEYQKGDLADFKLDRKFDLAGIFMDSLCYLYDNDSVLSHLRSVAQVLNPQGIYVLEMSHPRDVFSIGKSTTNAWEVEKGGLWTSVVWGDKDDAFDPITQITETTVTLNFRANGKEQELIEKAPARCFTCNEFKALVTAEGSFEIVAIYGAMNIDVPFSNDKTSWRMIPVLRKRT